MGEDYLKKLVNRYLEKKSTDEELEIFVDLMKQGKLDQYIQDAMNKDLDEHLQAEPRVLPERKNFFLRLRWPVAAALTLAMGTLAYLSFPGLSSKNLVKIKIIRINNQALTIRKQLLPDGSTVWLNPHTQLNYPVKFGKLREVTMQGEAFFEVTKDHAHPFVITSGKVVTKVWGTSFRIRSIPGEKDTKVSVLTGKVSVSVPGQEVRTISSGQITREKFILLLPEQEATYQQSEHQLIKTPTPATSDMMLWHKSDLHFENTPLIQITAQLSSYYHVQLTAEGEALNKSQLTADFNGRNLADILVLICKSMHTSYSREDNRIILRTTDQKPISIN